MSYIRAQLHHQSKSSMKILSSGEYYGDKRSELHHDGIMLSKYKYTGIKTDWHYHENPYFMYVLQGNMKDCNRRATTLCPTGSLMFNNWEESHYGSKHSTDAAGFHLEFEKSWLQKHDITFDVLEGSKLIQQPQVHFLFAKLYRELSLTDTFSEVTIESLLVQICDYLKTEQVFESNKRPEWVDKLKDLLHSDENTLNLGYLSQQLDVHPVHISRTASKYLHVSLGEYIRQCKLKTALPLLLHSPYSLTEIAYQSGFSDQSHFNRVFKSHFNITPKTYRARLMIDCQC